MSYNTGEPSKRKPFNDRAGYVCSRRNDINRGWVVIYDARLAGIDASERWIASCELHSVFVEGSSVAKLRPCLKIPDFCEECMKNVTTV